MIKKSCIYLQGGIYFAPNQVRACCQRFFHDGKIKGDVVILDGVDSKLTFEQIQSARKNLIQDINRGADDRCNGCNHLVEKDWPEIEQEAITTISIEDHSVCNMRCTYCSDVYYGGKRADYNILEIIKEIPALSTSLHIAWGGGEPTSREDFENFFLTVDEKFKPTTQRIFTNSLIYSPGIQRVLDERRASITTSVDAGSEKVFNLVRGAKKIDRVMRNLSIYSKNSPDLITVKYIFTEDNFDIHEIDLFIDLIEGHNLKRCNFLISSDFKQEVIPDYVVESILYFYYALEKTGIYALTFDDHIFNKLRSIGSKLDLIQNINSDHDFTEFIKNNKVKPNEEIILWGTGEFSKYLIRSSKNIKEGVIKIHSIVDGNPGNIGKVFEGYIVNPPESISELKNDIVIASSNYYGEIVNQIHALGVSLSRIRPNFIL